LDAKPKYTSFKSGYGITSENIAEDGNYAVYGGNGFRGFTNNYTHDRAGLDFTREEEHTIYYEGIDVGKRRADFVIEEQLVVELKALVNLEDVHIAQAKNYTVAYDFPKGLLINFGSQSLRPNP